MQITPQKVGIRTSFPRKRLSWRLAPCFPSPGLQPDGERIFLAAHGVENNEVAKNHGGYRRAAGYRVCGCFFTVRRAGYLDYRPVAALSAFPSDAGLHHCIDGTARVTIVAGMLARQIERTPTGVRVLSRDWQPTKRKQPLLPLVYAQILNV